MVLIPLGSLGDDLLALQVRQSSPSLERKAVVVSVFVSDLLVP